MLKNLIEDEGTILDFQNKLSDLTDIAQSLSENIEKPAGLDSKTAELINVALSIKLLKKRSLEFRLKKASDEGASRQEIIDAANLAILMSGGPPLVYLVALKFALDEFEILRRVTNELD